MLMLVRLVGVIAAGSLSPPESDRSITGFPTGDPCVALRQLATSTRPQLWRNASGWLTADSSHASCCHWHGVECGTAGDVTALQLYGNQLQGTLPAESFGAIVLPELRVLSVGYGNISGTLPSTLTQASKLEILDARVNFLSGSLPQLPSSLRFLSLHYNLIGGTFPPLTGLRSLRQVDVVHNQLSGTLATTGWSVSTAAPTGLQVLNLGYNRISGTVPAQLGALSRQALRVIDLGPNLITHVDTSICPLLAEASVKHLRCGLAKLPLLCPLPSCVYSAPLHCGAVCHNASELPFLVEEVDTISSPTTGFQQPTVASSSLNLARHVSKRRRSGPPSPQPPSASTLRWTDVSPGGAHTCGLINVPTGPNLRCWGSNSSGQLGSALLQRNRFLQVSASDGDHTCALRMSGVPVCFGLNNYGQANLPSTVAASPQQFISTGRYHTCSLSQEGALVCFGRNTEGQTDVPALPAHEYWVRVRSGGHFTCGTSSAGAIKCWGCRADAPPNSVDPDGCKFGRGQTLVAHRKNVTLNGSTLQSGAYSSCAITTRDGPDNIACWGGVETAPGGFTWTAVAPGRYAWCGLTTASSIICWGMRGMCIEKQPPSPMWSELSGHCDLTQAAIPPAPPRSPWKLLASGGWHACAIASGGELLCWGADDTNQTRVPTK